MATVKPKRIHLLGRGRHEEAVAGGTITPGMLLANSATLDTGGRPKVVAHSVAGGRFERAFALEDALQGKTIDDNYSSGDLVAYELCATGDVVYAWLKAGEVVTTTDFLTSAGDGTLKKGSGTDHAVGVPLDASDNSDSNTVEERIRVRLF